MAITYNNLQSAINTTTLSSYTPPSLTDACLVVIVTSEDIGDNDPITSITFGGVSLTIEVIAHSLVGTNAQDVAIAYLLNPSTTSGNIVVSGSERQSIIALTLDNVDQASPIDATGTREVSSGTDLEVSAATTNANSFVVSGAVGDNDANVLTLTTGTKIISLTPSSASSAVAVSTQASAGAFSHDWVSDMSLFRAASALVAFNVEAGGSGISLTGTTPSSSYNAISSNISLTGEVVVSGTTTNYSYSSVSSSVLLTPSIDIIGSTTSYSYDSVNGSIDLSGLISVIGVSTNYSYSAQPASIILQGSISFTGTSTNYAYNALNGTIILKGPVVLNPRNLIRVSRKNNTVRVKRNNNIVRVR